MTGSLEGPTGLAADGPLPGRDDVDRRPRWDWVRVALLVLVALGLFLRLWQYGHNRSLWLDEAWLAESIVNRPLAELVTEPPKHDQRAPVGYLAAAKLSQQTFGDSEPALRLVSLLSGLAALLLASWSAPALFRSSASRLCFVGLVSLSPILVYYSTELKPYATDATTSLFIVLAIVKHDDWRHGTLWLALGGAVATWLSYPSVFVLAGMGATALVRALTQRRWDLSRRLGAGIVCWIAAFTAHWALSISPLLEQPAQARAWASGFPPAPLEWGPALSWVGESLAGFVYLSFRQVRAEGLATRAEWFDAWNIILMALVTTAVAMLAHRSKWGLLLLTTPAMATLGAAFLGIYPFRNRLLLFLTPLLYALVASLVESLCHERASWVHRLAVVLAIGALVPFLAPSARRVVTPDDQSNIKGALSFMAEHALPGDRLAVSTWSWAAFDYYGPRYGFARSQAVLSVPRSGRARRLLKDLRARGADGRVWLLFSHRLYEGQAWVRDVGRLAPVLKIWEGDGALAALIDVGDAADGRIGTRGRSRRLDRASSAESRKTNRGANDRKR
jgi:hypothetical protein